MPKLISAGSQKMAKNQRFVVTEKCQPSKVHGYKKIPKNQRCSVPKNTKKIKRSSVTKNAKTQRSQSNGKKSNVHVNNKMPKILGLKSHKTAKNQMSTATENIRITIFCGNKNCKKT